MTNLYKNTQNKTKHVNRPGFAGASQADAHELGAPVLGGASQQTSQVRLDGGDAAAHDLVGWRAQ